MTNPDEEERLETIHFNNVVQTFEQYRAYSLSANSRRLRDYYALPRRHQILLDSLGWRKKIDLVDERIEANTRFLRTVINYPEIFEGDSDLGEKGEIEHDDEDVSGGPGDVRKEDPDGDEQDEAVGMNFSADDEGPKEPHPYDALHEALVHPYGSHSHSFGVSRSPTGSTQRVSDSDMDKLRSTLKQFVRDWSAEGKGERDSCYTPILVALDSHFASTPKERRASLRVLVPGAGLARLPYEVVQRGYSCQGNEFSHFMLLSSYYILNRSSEVKQHTIYPYIHSFSNMRSSETLLKGFKIPDVLPSSLPSGPAFSLVAGDFEEIYGKLKEGDEREPQQGKWDAVLTCFFIDTAKNVVNYLNIIRELLAPGGVWINLGPLLWHFENSGNPLDTSIELSLDEVLALAEKIGFKIGNQKMVDTKYVGIEDSMLSHVYHASFWTATKKQTI